jgi:hypothetical protein
MKSLRMPDWLRRSRVRRAARPDPQRTAPWPRKENEGRGDRETESDAASVAARWVYASELKRPT